MTDPLRRQPSSCREPVQRILWDTRKFDDELEELSELARELPPLDSSVLNDAQLADARAVVRELRDILDSKLTRSVSDIVVRDWSVRQLREIIAKLWAQPPWYAPLLLLHVRCYRIGQSRTADQVRTVELLLHLKLGLPLPICWEILDTAGYWALVRGTDILKMHNWHWQSLHPDVINLRVAISGEIALNRVRRVVLAIGGHNASAHGSFFMRTRLSVILTAPCGVQGHEKPYMTGRCPRGNASTATCRPSAPPIIVAL